MDSPIDFMAAVDECVYISDVIALVAVVGFVIQSGVALLALLLLAVSIAKMQKLKAKSKLEVDVLKMALDQTTAELQEVRAENATIEGRAAEPKAQAIETEENDVEVTELCAAVRANTEWLRAKRAKGVIG